MLSRFDVFRPQASPLIALSDSGDGSDGGGRGGGQPNLASNNKHPFCIYICPLSSQDRNGGALALAVEQGVLSPKRQSRVMVEELATGPQHLKPIRELWNIPQGSSIFATGHHKDPHRDGCCDSDTDKQSTR